MTAPSIPDFKKDLEVGDFVSALKAIRDCLDKEGTPATEQEGFTEIIMSLNLPPLTEEFVLRGVKSNEKRTTSKNFSGAGTTVGVCEQFTPVARLRKSQSKSLEHPYSPYERYIGEIIPGGNFLIRVENTCPDGNGIKRGVLLVFKTDGSIGVLVQVNYPLDMDPGLLEGYFSDNGYMDCVQDYPQMPEHHRVQQRYEIASQGK